MAEVAGLGFRPPAFGSVRTDAAAAPPTAPAATPSRALAPDSWQARVGDAHAEAFTSRDQAHEQHQQAHTGRAAQNRQLQHPLPQLLRLRARTLWGAKGAEHMLERAAQLAAVRPAVNLRRELAGHDALERHTLLAALLERLAEDDPLFPQAQELYAEVHDDADGQLQALQNVACEFTALDDSQPGAASALRKAYVGSVDEGQCVGAASLARTLAAEFPPERFASALRAMGRAVARETASRGVSPGGRRTPAARVHLALANAASVALVEQAHQFGDAMLLRSAALGLRSERSGAELAVALLDAAESGCQDGARLLKQLFGDQAADASAHAGVLHVLRAAVSDLKPTIWPAHHAGCQAALLASLDALRTQPERAAAGASVRSQELMRQRIGQALTA